MPVRFEGFARIVQKSALRPGRWVATSLGQSTLLCFVTESGEGARRLILTFRSARVEDLQFAPRELADLPGPFVSVEDEIVFSAGAGAHPVQLIAPTKRPIVSGSLLRLVNGDLGIGFAGPNLGELKLISLVSGEEVSSFELVFDYWTLSLRRGAVESLVGKFKGGLDRQLRRIVSDG